MNTLLPYDICQYKSYDIFKNFTYVGEHKNAMIKKDSDVICVQYFANTGGSSAGFRILLNTIPGKTYSMRVTATLNEGDQAFIDVASCTKQLVPRTYRFCTGKCTRHEIHFVAEDTITYVGILFFYGDKTYNLEVSEFIVVQGYDERFGDQIGPYQCPSTSNTCGQSDREHTICYQIPGTDTTDSSMDCKDTKKCKYITEYHPQNQVIPTYDVVSSGSYCSDCGSEDSHCCNKLEKNCTPKFYIISLDFTGRAGDCLVNPCCTGDCFNANDMYFLETRNCKPGCCKLWECQDGKYVWIGTQKQPYYFFDLCSRNIYIICADTCSILPANLGDKVLDCVTGIIYEFDCEGWKRTACNLTGPQGPQGPIFGINNVAKNTIDNDITNQNMELFRSLIDEKMADKQEGPQGLEGLEGPQGNDGQDGQDGFQGLQGPSGENINNTNFIQVTDEICSNENHVAIIPDETNTDNTSISIGPKGMGFLSAQRPTPNSNVGGECRGKYSVDWQMSRNNPMQVAQGPYGVIGGGSNNRIASNTISGVIAGGKDNNINLSNHAAIGGGGSNYIDNSAFSTINGGSSNSIVSNPTSSILGGFGLNIFNTVIPQARIACGQFNNEGTSDNIIPATLTDIGPFGAAGIDRVFVIGDGTSNIKRHNLFSIDNLGNLRTSRTGGSIIGGGADYAEYFESYDGTKLPIGTTMCIDPISGKIFPASYFPDQTDFPIGVISGNALIIGNSADEEWHGKYQYNNDGSIIYELVTEYIDIPVYEEIEEIIEEPILTFDTETESYIETIEQKIHKVKIPCTTNIPIYNKDGIFLRYYSKPVTKQSARQKLVSKLSDNYDASLKYIPRSMRKEWNIVGLLGQVKIIRGQKIHPDWFLVKMGSNETNDIDDNNGQIYDTWLIK